MFACPGSTQACAALAELLPRPGHACHWGRLWRPWVGGARQRHGVARVRLVRPLRVRVEELHGEARRVGARRQLGRDQRRALQPGQAGRPGLRVDAAVRVGLLVARAALDDVRGRVRAQRAARHVPAQQLHQRLVQLRAPAWLSVVSTLQRGRSAAAAQPGLPQWPAHEFAACTAGCAQLRRAGRARGRRGRTWRVTESPTKTSRSSLPRTLHALLAVCHRAPVSGRSASVKPQLPSKSSMASSGAAGLKLRDLALVTRSSCRGIRLCA